MSDPISPSQQKINEVLALYTECKYSEALPLAQAMTVQFPRHGFCWTMLGTLLMHLGRNEEALEHMRNAAVLSPDNPDAHNNLGMIFRNVGRLQEAEASYQRAIQLDPIFFEAHNNLAITLQDLGRPSEAETSYRRAIEISPDFAEAYNNLGNSLLSLGSLVEAEASYRRAVELRPNFVDALNNLGNILLDVGRVEEAEASYRRAIALKPDYASAYGNLGSALTALGNMVEAENALSKAIELAPDDARILSTALTNLTYKQDDPRFNQVETVYARRSSLPLEEHVKLNFAMGKAMENIGQYDKAFAAYEEGNKLHYASHPFDETEFDRSLEKTCTFFNANLFRECAELATTLPATQDERVPIFIVGMLRSGTTLIEQILSSHSHIFGAGELPLLQAVLALNNSESSSSNKDALLAIRKLGKEYLDQVWKLAPEAKYITDKLPGNYFHLGLIHLMLPNAKIIHSMRDPMDTCFSCYSLRFSHGHEYSYDFATLGRQYVRYLKLMKHWHSVLPPGRILDVRYENIVADPELEARRMLEHLGLSWEPSCINFHKNQRAVHTASVAQVRKPIYSSSIARWQHFENHLQPLADIISSFPCSA